MRRRIACSVGAAMALLLLMPPPAVAQRGGGGGAPGVGIPMSQRSRLDILEYSFDLEGKQKDAIKTILDDAHKSAAPVREQLRATRDALSAAIMTNAGQAAVDQATQAYAAQATAMTAIEMKALAGVLGVVTPEQRNRPNAVRTAFFLARGMFLDDRRWNAIPEPEGY
jgi:Spy/CpxP family protein refolding chaperone